MALVVLFSIAILWNFHRFILNYSIYTYGFLSPQNGGGDPPPRYSFPLMLWGDDAGGVDGEDISGAATVTGDVEVVAALCVSTGDGEWNGGGGVGGKCCGAGYIQAGQCADTSDVAGVEVA